MSGTVIISLIGTLVGMLITVGGVFIAVGGLKQKIHDSVETNKAQEEHIKTLASKDELAKAIKRSDELLVLMQKRVDEDRLSGERRYTELYGLLNVHSERIRKFIYCLLMQKAKRIILRKSRQIYWQHLLKRCYYDWT